MGMDSESRTSIGPLGSDGRRCPHCGTFLPVRGTHRRFFISDAMLLVAASAGSLVIVRGFVSNSIRREPGWAYILAVVVAGLISWTPASLALRLRRPRPALRRLARQPGFVATLIGTSIIALGVVTVGILALVRASRRWTVAATGGGLAAPRPDAGWWLGVVLHYGAIVGPAIIGAWLLLAVSGHRRPERGWVDPLGRMIGVLWIVLFVINSCARLSYLRG